MAANTSTLAIVLVFMCFGTLIPSGLATRPVTNPCFKPLTITGCAREIYQALSAGTGTFGPECCNAINGLSDYCWPLLFRVDPTNISSFLKDICSNEASSPAPAPVPGI